MGRHERLIEDHGERFAQLFAGAGHVAGDRRRLSDHLVLKPGIELHMTGLVDLLGGEKAASPSLSAAITRPANLVVNPLLGEISDDSAQ